MYYRNNIFKTRCFQHSEGILIIEGLDVPILQADYEANTEIMISIFQNSSFLPNYPMGTTKVELKDLLDKCQQDLIENEPCKFVHFEEKGIFDTYEFDLPCNNEKELPDLEFPDLALVMQYTFITYRGM